MLNVIMSFSNHLISSGLMCILAGEEDLQVQVVSGPALLGFSLNNKSPDLLLLDFYVLENFISEMPENSKILLLDTGLGEEKIIYALIAKHISGVIEMNSDVALLKKAMATVKKGHLWINRKIIGNLIARLSGLSKLWNLTETEQHVLQLIGKGMEDSAIAKNLKTKESRVRLQIESLKKKSKARNRWDLVNISREYFDVTISSN